MRAEVNQANARDHFVGAALQLSQGAAGILQIVRLAENTDSQAYDRVGPESTELAGGRPPRGPAQPIRSTRHEHGNARPEGLSHRGSG